MDTPNLSRQHIKQMPVARLSGSRHCKNDIFNADSPGNRDNCYMPYIRLKERLLENGISLNTPDMIMGQKPVFDLSMDVGTINPDIPSYALILETPFMRPSNGDLSKLLMYRKVFTWDDHLVDGKQFVKLNYANPTYEPVVDGYANRNRLCCLIAGNKRIKVPDDRELYSKRIHAIRWFEQNAPEDFDLYGIGWDSPPACLKHISKRMRKLYRIWTSLSGQKPFPSYRGMIDHKHTALTRTRFSICYENIRDIPGYITEKIFDCFGGGCVPIYWGADNVSSYIPQPCFIDRRQFKDDAEVYKFIKSIGEDDYVTYQENIAAFLNTGFKKSFSADNFAEVITKTILDDLPHLPESNP